MRKQIRTAAVAAAGLLLALSAGVAWADLSGLDLWGAGRQGVYLAWDGAALRAPGIIEKNKVAASVDTRSGLAAESAIVTPEAGEAREISLKLQADGISEILDFAYIEDAEGHTTVLPAPGLGYTAENIPGSRQALISYKASIYLLDLDKPALSKFLQDQAGGYDINKRPKAAGESTPPMVIWGERPSVNPQGTKVVFWTNRSVVNSGNPNGENWVKDLRTGEEKRIFGDGYTLMGWDNLDRFYLSRGNSGLYMIDARTGSAKRLLSSAAVAAVSGSYLIYQPGDGKLVVRNLPGSTGRTFTDAGLNHVRSMAASPGSPWAAVISAPERSSSLSTLILINMETLEHRTMKEPDGYSIVSVSWQDAEMLLVHMQKKNSWEEKTYFIPVNQLDGGEG